MGTVKSNFERQKDVAGQLVESLSYRQKKMLASLLVNESATLILESVSDEKLSKIQDNILKVYEKIEDGQRAIMLLDDGSVLAILAYEDMLSEIEMLHELFDDKCSFWFDNPHFESTL